MKTKLLVFVTILVMVFAIHPFASACDPASIESWSSCTGILCIDAPPQGPQGLDGSGGWGWDNTANAPVKLLTVGVPATFTVTVLQDAISTPLCNNGGNMGTITLTFSSRDFSLSNTSGRGAIGTTQPFPFDRGGVKVFTYSGDFWCHGDQSDSFTFTPLNETTTALALVTATVAVAGQQASETFPIAIAKKVIKKH